MTPDHPWVLTAPWYRWPRPGDGRFGRRTAPIFQKYAAPTFVNDFLAEPQRSLRYKDEDFVHRIERRSPRPKGRLSALTRVRTEQRKIFLDTHNRFYLVVCELHCDAPGFPSADRDKVCEAGMVIRRRVAPAPAEAREVLAAALEEVYGLEAKLDAARRLTPSFKVPTAGARPVAAVGEALRERCGKEVDRLVAEHAEAHGRLVELAERHGVEIRLEGWVPGEHAGIGAWRTVEETPQRIEEEIVPLQPLIPDPRDGDHSAAKRSLWFGVLPTGSSDVDETAAPRFDDRALYQARCFVRRHDPGCPKRPERRDCKGELVWSAPTEVYRLAAPMDLDGTSNRPVTIQLPDLTALEAQAAALPPGAGVGMRMVSPESSAMPFGADPSDPGATIDGRIGGVSVCFFAIPLLTIVANFVFRLFLPIVVFAFGLWFLLKLRFCILPSFELDAGLAASLEATPPGVEIDASLEADLKAAFVTGFGPEMADEMFAQLDLSQLGRMALHLSTDFSESVPPDLAAGLGSASPGTSAPKASLPGIGARLEYYERVEAVS